MTPESKGTEKRLDWLDERRRKDAEVLGRLGERMAALEGNLGQQAKQLQDLASEVTKLSAQTARMQRFDDALDKHRKDTTQRLATGQKRQLERQRDLEALWKADQKQAAMSLDELRRDLSALDDLRHGLAAQQQEAMRLSKGQDAIEARTEKLEDHSRDRARALAALQEAEAQGAGRIAELQAAQTELRKLLDAQSVRLDNQEDSSRRLERQGSELESTLEEVREAQRISAEQLAAQLAEFRRGWKGWEGRFDEFTAQADQLNERILAYEETYRSLIQLRGEMENVIQRLERRITEVGELQRLAEDRLKQEWSAFKGDNQKRWSGQQLAGEERWKDHDRKHERLEARLEEHHASLTDLVADLAELAELSRRRVMDALAMVRAWVSEVADEVK